MMTVMTTVITMKVVIVMMVMIMYCDDRDSDSDADNVDYQSDMMKPVLPMLLVMIYGLPHITIFFSIVPDGTNPLPEPKSIYQQKCRVVQFHQKKSVTFVWRLHLF